MNYFNQLLHYFNKFIIIAVTVENKKKYLDARLENSELIIFTTEAFDDFEEEAQAARIDEIRLNLKFECYYGSDTLVSRFYFLIVMTTLFIICTFIHKMKSKS